MAQDDGRRLVDASEDPGGHLAEENLGGDSNPEILPHSEPWRSIVHAIGVVEQAVGALLLFMIVFLVIALVAQRYLPGANFPWTGEVARLSMVWATFVMAGYLAARDRHIAIHVVDYVLGGRALAAVKLLVNLVVLVTCVVLLYATYQLIESDVGQVTAAGEIPLRLVNAVPIIGFVLTALRAVLWIVLSDIPELTGRKEVAG
ncbi:MAG TPA: TRAP transporter small permease subunit [Candidatus Limnocylindria bacterium]|nr:TRAP transporter small permease subunit [Candidatus Limnocylindria bacterium]